VSEDVNKMDTPNHAEINANNPFHGVTLEKILTFLVEEIGWKKLSRHIEVRCFMFDPSIKSSLKFLRRTPWAREKLESLYLEVKGHDFG
jgi:uncharacterized protein (DUF2132 family)